MYTLGELNELDPWFSFFCNWKFTCTLTVWKRKTGEIVDSCGLDQRCWHPAMFYSGLCQRQGPEQNIARRKHIWIRFQLNIEKTQDRYRFCASHRKWYFVAKIVLTCCENFLKFEAEGREFSKFLRSLEQFTYSNSESSEQFLDLFLEVSQI